MLMLNLCKFADITFEILETSNLYLNRVYIFLCVMGFKKKI